MSDLDKKDEQTTNSAATTPTKSVTEIKTIDPKEVTEHNKKDDIWIILKDKTTKVDKVYDVTKFLDEVINLSRHIGQEFQHLSFNFF